MMNSLSLLRQTQAWMFSRPLRQRNGLVFFSSTRSAAVASSSSSSSLSSFPHVEVRQTRWNDTDGFGHINNAVYYQFMDDAINMHLIDRGIGRNYPRFIAQNGIQYQRPLTFPTPIHVGIAVTKLGKSSVIYQVGFFAQDDDDDDDNLQTPAAIGTFVHVYVNETTGKPIPIPDKARVVLQELLVETPPPNEADQQGDT